MKENNSLYNKWLFGDQKSISTSRNSLVKQCNAINSRNKGGLSSSRSVMSGHITTLGGILTNMNSYKPIDTKK